MKIVEFVDRLNKPTLDVMAVAKKHKVSPQYVKHQLSIGIKVEQEHTSDIQLAKEIALDHLGERPDYYQRLKKVEQ